MNKFNPVFRPTNLGRPPTAIVFLIGIILLGALLRIFFLSSIPNGFFCDEATRAYNAYSILKTGCDQYGRFLPSFVRVPNFYFESTYEYLAIPFIAIFGLNEFSARLPIALAGIITILVLYKIVKEIFDQNTALIAAFLLAINPWHIHCSRHVVGVGTIMVLFFCLAIYFFLKSTKSSPKYLLLSFLFFTISLHTYYSARVFIPLFVFCLGLMFYRELWKIKKYTITSYALFLTVLILLGIFWISPEGITKAKMSLEISFLKNLKYYISFFSPLFLFFKGVPEAFYNPSNMGQLHFFEAITVPIGIFLIVREARRKEIKILWLWLVLYPIPAALVAVANKSPIRVLVGAPLFCIISARGFSFIIDFVKRKTTKNKLYLNSILAVVILNLMLFSKIYFLDYPKYGARHWQYGMKEAINYAHTSPYDVVIMSNNLFWIHTFVLFYTKYSPRLCQKALSQGRYIFGKFHLFNINDKTEVRGKWLFMGEPGEIINKLGDRYKCEIKLIIKDPTGYPLLELVEVSK